LCVARGRSTVHERVYPARFTHIAELSRMGARLQRQGPHCTIDGVDALQGAVVTAPDIRAGGALVVAGLAASGRTVVDGVDQVDRGYQALEEKLRELGAAVHRRQSESLDKPTRKSA
ncbi:MAG: UDP-N-acetylglucosamine 1-carboxyvinyltransferase, partial [Planctomycetota bacterium]